MHLSLGIITFYRTYKGKDCMVWYPGISRQEGLSTSLLLLVLVIVLIFLHILKYNKRLENYLKLGAIFVCAVEM